MQAIESADAMKRTSLQDHPCSIARAVDAAGEWWSPLILRDVAYGVRRFRDLQDDLGVSANVLTDRLESLVSEGLLEPRLYQERPARHEYHLTEKGLDLVPALLALMRWGDRWCWPGASGPVRVLHDECGHDVSVQVRCDHCDSEVAAQDLRVTLASPDARLPRDGTPGHVTAGLLAAAPDGVTLNP
jgi:DNA-binding HxlR family transcriptional regulator